MKSEKILNYLKNGIKLNPAFKKIFQRIFSITVKLVVLFIAVEIVGTVIIVLLILSPLGDYEFKTFTSPSEYSEALGYACDKDKTTHFPKEIPQNAKNVLLHKPNDCWFGSDYFSLSFQTNKQYIDNELKKHKFIETEGPYQTDEEYSDNSKKYIAVNDIGLNKEGFKFYTIGKGTREEYGIAINDKTNRILYYSIMLD